MTILPSDSTLNKELRRDEGVEYSPYTDTVGIQTVGVGHNMKVKPLPASWKFPLTDAQINELLEQDLLEVFAGLNKNLPWWQGLTPGRQRLMVNLGFNMGVPGLLKFRNTLEAIKNGQWGAAASGLRSSKWANQVGSRCDRMCSLVMGDVK